MTSGIKEEASFNYTENSNNLSTKRGRSNNPQKKEAQLPNIFMKANDINLFEKQSVKVSGIKQQEVNEKFGVKLKSNSVSNSMT